MNETLLISTAQGVTAQEMQTVVRALSSCFSGKSRGTVFAFGSRVKGGFRKNSDLDLWMDLAPPPTLADLAELRRAFEESDIPYSIDLLDASRTPPEVLNSIQALLVHDGLKILEL